MPFSFADDNLARPEGANLALSHADFDKPANVLSSTRQCQCRAIDEYLARVYCPGDSFVFATFPHTWLPVDTGELCSALLAERFLCDGAASLQENRLHLVQ